VLARPSLSPHTVVRGGFGISYSHWNRTRFRYPDHERARTALTTLEYVYPSSRHPHERSHDQFVNS